MLGLEPLWRLKSGRQAVRERLLQAGEAYGLRVDPGRAGVGAVGGRAATGRDPQVAGPRLADPGARRADRGVDAAGERVALRHARASSPQPGLARDLHLAQARRGAAGKRQHRRAQAGPRRAAGALPRKPARRRLPKPWSAALRTRRLGRDRRRAVSRLPARHRCWSNSTGCRLAGGGHAGLHDIDLQVRAGEVMAIAGVAGNGQQTLAGLAERRDSRRAGRRGADRRPSRCRRVRATGSTPASRGFRRTASRWA